VKKFVEMSRKLVLIAGMAALMLAAGSVFADDAASSVAAAAEVSSVAAEVAAPAPEVAAPVAEEAAAAPAAPEFNKGDIAWMLTSTLLVMFMALPGLALFYGGMVRAKNVLSLSMQIFVTYCLICILWAVYGYSLAFTSGSAFIGGLDRLFLKDMLDAAGNLTAAATFSKGIYIPEYLYAAFQMTFAALTPCLIVGAFAERMKFTAVLLFCVVWFTFAYLPIAHMVWFWSGPDAYTTKEAADAATAGAGYIFKLGALDFAGGTVVHINAGIAGLVGCIMIGKRKGFGSQSLAPHNVPYTMIGAALLWVGWFGFNVGSNLEANAFAAQVFINTFLATAAAVLAWTFGEWVVRGKPTMLGAASGAVAGLVAITPACGWVGPMGSIVIGFVGGLVCMFAVLKLKAALGYDDSLDVFGVHCVGGIIGALLTGVFNSPDLGGTGVYDYVAGAWGFGGIGPQVLIQAKAVGITILWSGVVSFIAFKLIDIVIGLRVTEEVETEGLDTAEHGERAYHS
jgi:Amt family ammonium transporter